MRHCLYVVPVLALLGLEGCVFVAADRSPGRGPAHVTVYNGYETPPAPPARGARSFRFDYYPTCQVYYSHHRHCYVWHGKRGWTYTAAPPPRVVLNPSECVTVDLEKDDPEPYHAEVVARCVTPPAPPWSQRPQAPPGPVAQTPAPPAPPANTPGPAPVDDDPGEVVQAPGHSGDAPGHTGDAPGQDNGNGKGKGNGNDEDKQKSKGKSKNKGKGNS